MDVNFELFTSSYSQDILPISDGKVVYEGVIQMDSICKYDLYFRAKRVIIDQFRNSKGAIQHDDKDNGIIIGKGKAISGRSLFHQQIWIMFWKLM